MIVASLILPFFLLGLLMASWWRLSIQEREFHDWRAVFSQAERLREEGDLYQAKVFYSQAGRIANWHQDWQGLLAVTCGMKKLDGAGDPFRMTYALLLRAMVAAERKQSRAGIHAVAKAFTAIGERRSASLTLSRIEKDWAAQTDESSFDAVWWGCWESNETAATR